jgi:hypothetical protein
MCVGIYVELCNMQPWKMPGEGHVFLFVSIMFLVFKRLH